MTNQRNGSFPKEQTDSEPTIGQGLYEAFDGSLEHRREIENLAVRKAWDLPAGDGLRDLNVSHNHEQRSAERSPLEKVLTAGALAAAIATPIGGLIALPSLLNAINPQPKQEVSEPSSDENDVFELRLRPIAE